MGVQRAVRQALRRRGIELSRYHQSVTARRQRILQYLEIQFLVDIGANSGQYASALRAAGYRGTIVSLEPSEDAYAALEQKTRKDPRWHAQRVAVGDKPGTLVLNRSRNSLFNSLLPVLDLTVDASAEAEVIGAETTDVVTLDAIIASYPQFEGALGFKADVQGYERQVLDGAEESLRRARYVELELSPKPTYDGQILLPEALDRMERSGFTLSLVENVLPDASSGRALQFNGIFTRD